MELKELCPRLRRQRRMYLGDDRYATAVAFIDGFNVALDGRPLRGFKEWVSQRLLGGHSPLHWSHIISSMRFSGRGTAIPPELNALLFDDLLRLLEEFAEERPSKTHEHREG